MLINTIYPFHPKPTNVKATNVKERPMKALIKGVWHAGIADTPALRLARAEEKKRYFRDKVTADGSSGFAAAKGRYHLYVSYACPWAHRAILYRALKGLEDVVPMSVAHPSWSRASASLVFPASSSTSSRGARLSWSARWSGKARSSRIPRPSRRRELKLVIRCSVSI